MRPFQSFPPLTGIKEASATVLEGRMTLTLPIGCLTPLFHRTRATVYLKIAEKKWISQHCTYEQIMDESWGIR
jgi:hypothetical protein